MLVEIQSKIRTCTDSVGVRIFEHNFVDVKEKRRSRTVCTARSFDADSGKICRKDVRRSYWYRFSISGGLTASEYMGWTAPAKSYAALAVEIKERV